jgi:hypothetical protein
VNSNANGTVTPAGTNTVEYGENFTIEIKPNDGCELKSLCVNGVDSINDVQNGQLTLDNIKSDMTIDLIFNKIIYLISTSAGRNGSVTKTLQVEHGENVKIEFLPNLGYKVKNVTVDGETIGAVNEYIINGVIKSHIIAVEFELIFFNIKHGTNHLFINILSSKNTYIFILKEERDILFA